jgi:hypothetical protein
VSKSKLLVSRRALGKVFAGLGATAMWRGLLREAFAQTAPQPPRFVVLSNPHGCAPDFWRPRAPGGGPAGVTGWTLDFDPDSSLGPLEKHKSSLVLLEGLDLSCNYQTVSPILTGHNGGYVAPLTGRHSRSEKESMATDGPSIDYYAAKVMRTKPFNYKPLGYAGSSNGQSFDEAGVQVPFEYEIGKSFQNWFGALPTPGGTPDSSAATRAAAERSVVSYLNDRAKILRGRLAGAERLKLEAHMDALSLIDQRIAAATATLPIDCSRPTKPMNPTNDPAGYAGVMAASMDLTARMFACNLTRVANLTMDIGQSMPWLGLGSMKVHDDIAHGYRPENAQSARLLSKPQRWYATQVSLFIDRLKSIPEGNGTVYDNTIILWINELGDPARHMNNNVPFVLAGGGGPYPKGRFLQYGVASEYRDPQDPHTRLLTSLARVYGGTMASFGDPAFPGELPKLMG